MVDPTTLAELASDASADAAIELLWKSSASAIRDRVTSCEDHVAALLLDSSTDEGRDEAFMAAHRLAGTMGMFGMAAGSVLARDLEGLIEQHETPDHRVLDRMASIVNSLRDMVDARMAGSDGTSEPVGATGPVDGRASPVDEVIPSMRVGVVGSETSYLESLRLSASARGISFEHIDSPGSEGIDVIVINSRDITDLPTAVAGAAHHRPVMVIMESSRLLDRAEIVRSGADALITPSTTPATVLTLLEGLAGAPDGGITALAVGMGSNHHGAMIDGFRRERCAVEVVPIDQPLDEALEHGGPDALLIGDDLGGVDLLDAVAASAADPRWSAGLIVALPGTEAEAARLAPLALAAGADDVVPVVAGWPEIVRRVKLRARRVANHGGGRLGSTGDRRRFEDRIQARLDDRSPDQPLSVLYFRARDLGAINEADGFAAGDSLLREAERFLHTHFRSDDLVGLWVGGGLVVMIDGDREVGTRCLGQALSSLEQAGLAFGGGLATAPVDGDTVDRLVLAAKARTPGRRRGRSGANQEEHPTIVVVEDDPIVAGVVTELLESEAYRVELVGDGPDAVALLGQPDIHRRVSLVLLDITLPGVDGFGVLRAMQRANVLEHIPVVMLTARSQADEIDAAISLGAVDHVAKPFSPQVLLRRVERALTFRVS